MGKRKNVKLMENPYPQVTNFDAIGELKQVLKDKIVSKLASELKDKNPNVHELAECVKLYHQYLSLGE